MKFLFILLRMLDAIDPIDIYCDPTMKPEISFCTVVMNRLEHLKRTLPANIKNNESINVEFLILDYNSSDGCQEWILSNFKNEIENGKISYYFTSEPVTFHRSHSKNLAMKLAKGQIICNMDADNFSGANFAKYILEQYSRRGNIFISATNRRFNSPLKKHRITGAPDTIGRIAMKKTDFISLGGYDERFASYGFEDFDLMNRLELNGLQRVVINRQKFLQAIQHENIDRITNSRNRTNFSPVDIFLLKMSYFETVAIYLLNDGIYYLGTIIDDRTKDAQEFNSSFTHYTSDYDYSLKENAWRKGLWQKQNDRLILTPDVGNVQNAVLRNRSLTLLKGCGGYSGKFIKVTKSHLMNDLSIFRETVANRYLMHRNIDQKIVIANQGQFGKGTVFCNYDRLNPIYI